MATRKAPVAAVPTVSAMQASPVPTAQASAQAAIHAAPTARLMPIAALETFARRILLLRPTVEAPFVNRSMDAVLGFLVGRRLRRKRGLERGFMLFVRGWDLKRSRRGCDGLLTMVIDLLRFG